MKTHAQKLAAASDPSTPPEQLEELSHLKTPSLHHALALNPNTPVPVLKRLWEELPACILDNSILTLWEFTQSGQPADFIGHRALLALYNHLRQKGNPLPQELFPATTVQKMISSAISENNPAIFDFLPFEKDSSIRIELVKGALSRKLFDLFEKHAPDAVWEHFARDADAGVRLEFAALLRSAPADARPAREAIGRAARLLSENADDTILGHLVNCRFLPGDVVERLSVAPDPAAREALARCYRAPLPVLEKFATDTERVVRISLAKHCEVMSIRKRMLHDPNPDVRRALASNPTMPREILHEFDIEDEPDVVKALFRNPQADATLRSRILARRGADVQQVLLSMGKDFTPALYFANKARIRPEVLANVHKTTGLHPAIFEDLAHHDYPSVRRSVARRLTNCYGWQVTPRNLRILSLLAVDINTEVRLIVCADERLDGLARERLLFDSDAGVRKKTLTTIQDKLVSLRDSRRFTSYEQVYRDKSAAIERMAVDPDHLVRLALASCPETPPSAMKILFDDREAFIATAARAIKRWPFGAVLDLEKELGPAAHEKTFRHGETTPSAEALQLFAKSCNPFLRNLTAQCSRTRASDLKILATDTHPTVRESAQLHLAKRLKAQPPAVANRPPKT